MNDSAIIDATAAYVQEQFQDETSGHDWWHIYRVWNLALVLAKAEGADQFTVQLAALLHDLDDWKLQKAGHGVQTSKAQYWLAQLDVSETTRSAVIEVIDQVSFKGAGVATVPESLEAAVVQDADRLDAIGAIGVARAFTYGGHKGQLIYDPLLPVTLHASFEAYRTSQTTTINHFYEKLLLLKDRINTPTGKEMAERRHRFLEMFLEEFFHEWEQTNEPVNRAGTSF